MDMEEKKKVNKTNKCTNHNNAFEQCYKVVINTMYTERQKKLITSSACHSLKSTASNDSYLDTD